MPRKCAGQRVGSVSESGRESSLMPHSLIGAPLFLLIAARPRDVLPFSGVRRGHFVGGGAMAPAWKMGARQAHAALARGWRASGCGRQVMPSMRCSISKTGSKVDSIAIFLKYAN